MRLIAMGQSSAAPLVEAFMLTKVGLERSRYVWLVLI
jgi:hypothetical protein